MPSSNRYPKVNPVRPGGSRPQTYPRRTLAPYRPSRPWAPPVRKPGVFPGQPRPFGPFGKRLPLPGRIPPVVPRIALPWLRVFSRLNPWLFAALTLYELWQLYQEWSPPGDRSMCARLPKPYPQYVSYTGYGFCWSDTPYNPGVTFHRNWSPAHPYLTQHQPRNFPTHKRHESLWWKKIPATDPHPEMPPVGLPEPVPAFILPPQPMFVPFPWIPIAVPPLSPMPAPIPRPPFIPMFPNPEEGYSPRGNEAPNYPRRVKPKPKPQPKLNPRPPGRGTKERKLSGTAQQRKFLGWLLSGASEAGDILEALHDALPKEFQGRDHWASMFEHLYKHWDKVDMNEAFTNIWNNQVSDRYYGKAFQELQDALSEAGFDFPSPRDIGGQFGLSGLR